MDATVLHEMLSRKTKHQIIPNPYGVPPTEKTRLSSVWTGILADKLVCLSIIALYMRVFSTLAMVLRVPLILESSSSLYISRSGSSSCFVVGPLRIWDKTIQGGRCLNQINILLGIIAFDSATSIWVLFLSIPIVGRPQTSMRLKIVIVELFFVGAFASITATIRIPFLLDINFFDVDYTLVPFPVWSTIECDMKVVNVCLPTMAPLFQGWLSRLYIAARSKSYSTSQSEPL